ncbi:MAG: carbohydrate kinase [Candidatus Izemoplasmatales bacterium]
MGKLIGIGEALIDFLPKQIGVNLKAVEEFKRVAGGAPANVCACVRRLGTESVILTKLGTDAFGDYLIDTLNEVGVNTNYIKRTNAANTALAFVSLKKDGNRDFSFYRNPSADMLLEASEIEADLFKSGDILHFCSVDLVDAPIRQAHDQALKYAKENELLISFDPNVRLPLWSDHDEYKRIINKYINYADILKISDEEFAFITGESFSEERVLKLFRGNVKVIIYTEGAKGARVYTRKNTYQFPGFKVKAIDTTGAGDSFIGAFLYQLLKMKLTLNNLETTDYTQIIKFANAVGAIVASRKGAIPAMPNESEVVEFIKNNQ